jgi:hypothetical protein
MLLALGFDLAAMRTSIDATTAAVADVVGTQQPMGSSNPGGQPAPGSAGSSLGGDGQHRIGPRSDYRGDQGSTLMQPQTPQTPGAREGAAYGGGRQALQRVIGMSATASWSWFIAWALAGLFAVAGANMGARRRVAGLRERRFHEEEPGPARPLTPAHNV